MEYFELFLHQDTFLTSVSIMVTNIRHQLFISGAMKFLQEQCEKCDNEREKCTYPHWLDVEWQEQYLDGFLWSVF